MPKKYPTINTFINNHKKCLLCGGRTFLSLGSSPVKFDGPNVIKKFDGIYSSATGEKIFLFNEKFKLKYNMGILKIYCVHPDCKSGISANIKTGSITKIYYWLDLFTKNLDLIFAGGTNEVCDLINKQADIKALKIGKVDYKQVLDTDNFLEILKTYSLFS